MSFGLAVDHYLRRTLVDRAHPVVLSLDAEWQLRDVQGDADYWGLSSDTQMVEVREQHLQMIRDLFVGIDLSVEQNLLFVELPDGQFANIHMVPEGDGLHVVLLDARTEAERQRVSQQLGNDAELAGQEKNRAINRLKQIRTELERQRERLEEANALKNAFIATLSHEFRTPLTSIFGYLHLLERRLSGDAATQHSLRAIRRGATHLFGLAENLLEYGRSESGRSRLNPTRLELRQLAEDLRVMFMPLAQEEGLTLVVEYEALPLPLIHDEVRVRQIMINLISNAIRYTPRGSVAAMLRWDGATLQLSVTDTGIGIPDEMKAIVFKPFNTGGQQGSKGAGLGLSIVKRLVDHMHGSIELASVLGEGTRFSVSLPPLGSTIPDSERGPRQVDDPESWLIGGTALVVDDDDDIRDLVRTLLEDMGFRVHTAADANGAFDAAMQLRPDVTIVDVQMPGLSGNAAVFRLRAHDYNGRIISLSADDTLEARQAALAAGSDLYLTKPINIEHFVRAVRAAPRNSV
jgi:two-component system, sensor histidine kinase